LSLLRVTRGGHNGDRGGGVVVPATATYAVIAPSPSAVEVSFEEAEGGEGAAGRVVVLTNGGALTTTGAAASTVLMLYDGSGWVNIEALRAPMAELRQVQVLQAANDLDIGPHSLTAKRFQASGLRKGGVIFAGAEGVLSDSDQLTYLKGVLSAPALRVDKLVGDVDARGNAISNVLLPRARLQSASVEAEVFSLIGAVGGGLAVFDAKGRLGASKGLALDAEGRLGNGHTLSNVTIQGAQMVGLMGLGLSAEGVLTVPALGRSAGSLLTADAEGGVGSSGVRWEAGGNILKVDNIAAENIAAAGLTAGAVTATLLVSGKITADSLGTDTITSGSVTCKSVQADALTVDKLAAGSVEAQSVTTGILTTARLMATLGGDLDCASHQVRNALITGGSVHTTEVQADQVLVGALRGKSPVSGSGAGSGGAGGAGSGLVLVAADQEGRLRAGGAVEALEVGALTVGGLVFTSGVVDLAGAVLRNVTLDAESVHFLRELQREGEKKGGEGERLVVAEVAVAALRQAGGLLLTSDAAGRV
ncbi:hypothetical protein B484DRAFT_388991, partial [Ochromonadaceae sp. CCMP2298]